MTSRETDRGLFDIIDSFAIRRRQEFYLIGRLKEGVVQEGWYAHICLNPSLALTVKIERIEYVLMKAQEEYPVLVIKASDEYTDLLLGLNIGLEPVLISTEGAE